MAHAPIRFDQTPGHDTLTIEITDGLKMVVPNDIRQITPYVLLEQEDWFEDEIHFIRKLAQPGMAMVDIGANFGIYSLAMAQAIRQIAAADTPEDHGKFWAIEPASTTADHLRLSVKANDFKNIAVLQMALSDSEGDGYLTIQGSSELNALADGPGDDTEQVQLSTIDTLMADNFGDTAIDFMKIDAEGAEADILRGGAKFFADQSPLVMFELSHGDGLNTDLVQQFSAMGYNSYRLIPGLDILVPFDVNAKPCGFLLNLFACKEDCAHRLMDRGLMLHPTHDMAPVTPASWDDFLALQPWVAASNGQTGWVHWAQGDLRAGEQMLRDALCHWAAAHKPAAEADKRSPHEDASHRYAQLTAALRRIESHPAVHDQNAPGRIPYVLTAARILGDMGERKKRLEHLQITVAGLAGSQIQLPAPFLAPSSRFDWLINNFNMGAWLGASLREASNDLRSYSSCYTSFESTLEILGPLLKSPYPRPENARRYLLSILGNAIPVEGDLPSQFSILATRQDSHRNADLWQPHLPESMRA
ncbi:MAG: FkbM family methyltransferase [Pseudomonadota bacterium]